jgi:hypothetical protein
VNRVAAGCITPIDIEPDDEMTRKDNPMRVTALAVAAY